MKLGRTYIEHVFHGGAAAAGLRQFPIQLVQSIDTLYPGAGYRVSMYRGVSHMTCDVTALAKYLCTDPAVVGSAMICGSVFLPKDV